MGKRIRRTRRDRKNFADRRDTWRHTQPCSSTKRRFTFFSWASCSAVSTVTPPSAGRAVPDSTVTPHSASHPRHCETFGVPSWQRLLDWTTVRLQSDQKLSSERRSNACLSASCPYPLCGRSNGLRRSSPDRDFRSDRGAITATHQHREKRPFAKAFPSKGCDDGTICPTDLRTHNGTHN